MNLYGRRAGVDSLIVNVALPVPLLPQAADFWESELIEKFRATIRAWSDSGQQLRAWEDEHLLDAPRADALAAHKQALDRMILFGRFVSLSTADPHFPDRELAGMVRSTLQLYRDKLELFHGNMPAAEADKLLQEVFGEA